MWRREYVFLEKRRPIFILCLSFSIYLSIFLSALSLFFFVISEFVRNITEIRCICTSHRRHIPTEKSSCGALANDPNERRVDDDVALGDLDALVYRDRWVVHFCRPILVLCSSYRWLQLLKHRVASDECTSHSYLILCSSFERKIYSKVNDSTCVGLKSMVPPENSLECLIRVR